MAQAVAGGVRDAGAKVDIKRVPELVPEQVAKASHYKLDQAAPIAKIDVLKQYDAIILGMGTRFGRMSPQMATYHDNAGGLWARGASNVKIGRASASTEPQHGGQEAAVFSLLPNLMLSGVMRVGLP